MVENINTAFNEYVTGIPWARAPGFFDESSRKFSESCRLQMQELPYAGENIPFSSMVWDFNPYMKTRHGPGFKFKFDSLPENLVEPCKFFVLFKICGKAKMTTVKNRYECFFGIITNIIKRTSHKSIYTITTQDIHDEIKRRNVTLQREHSLYQSAFQVYDFLINYCDFDVPVDLKVLDENSASKKKQAKQINSKTPNIPEEYFQTILKTTCSVMRDEGADMEMRMMASAIVFISQTGLRASDFLSLTVDAMYSRTIRSSGHKVGYFRLITHKPSKAHQPPVKYNVFSNKLSTEAFNTMKALREQSELAEDSDFLFVLPKKNYKNANDLPYTWTRFHKVYLKFFFQYLYSEAIMEWEGISTTVYHHNLYREKKGTEKPFHLNVPGLCQFRVHLCTDLYNRGVKLEFIRRNLGHLTEYMSSWYIRPKDTYQENLEYSEHVIREIVSEGARPLGGNNRGDEIQKRILDYVAENGMNVKTDIEAIVKAFGDKVIIRCKHGGTCIRTSLIPCSNDAQTNSLMCAQGICPNLFFFVWDIGTTYVDFKTMEKTYDRMVQEEKRKLAEKELAKIRDIATHKLIPELDELDREIEIKGIDEVLDTHPDLMEIIVDREKIREEAEAWRRRKQQPA